MKKIILLASIFFIATAQIYAARHIKFTLVEDLCYDDNIYLRRNNKISSIISSTQLYADYATRLPGTNWKVGVDANIGYHMYSENPSRNNYMNAGLGISLGNRYLTLSDRVIYTADGINAEIDRAKRITNIASLTFRTPLSRKFSLALLARDTLHKYLDDDYERLNRNRIDLGARLYYHLTAKTSLYFSYLFYSIKYEKSSYNNSYGHEYSLGITGRLAPKVTGDARVTYNMRRYERDDKDVDLLGYFLSLKYVPTNRSSLTLFGSRKMEESSYRNNRYYISTEVGLKYEQKLWRKWSAALGVSYENVAYPNATNGVKRTDDYLRISPSLTYHFRENLVATLYYRYRCRWSNFDYAEYTNNRIGIRIKFYF
jgi:hypothetical protein